MIIKIQNKSSRDIPDELETAIFNNDLQDANRICEEYNLKIIEINLETDENAFNALKSKNYIIGDRYE